MTEHRLQPSGERIPIAIEEELKGSYLDYAMSVIVGRALPDVRDGLKPVHRRVLYGMWRGGNTANKAYKKSARIVGDVMGRYHPHGDAAIYDTIVRMAQPFSMRHVLVDGQGNFGSIDGDSPAAMRYTEIRLDPLAQEMLGDDLDKDTVDWAANYDGTLEEPIVLPSRFPNLLVNGSAGIAVGMATNIPPHNLGEVIEGTIRLARDPEITIEQLMQSITGPDFPTGAFIEGLSGVREAYTTGRGSIRLRARAVIEHKTKGKKSSIVVRELPYQVNKAKLVEQIAQLVHNKKLEGISDLRDESDREGVRVVIELKRDAVPQVVLNNLYKLTRMQTSFGIVLLGILNNQPRLFTLKELLGHFLDHRKEVVVRRTRYDLERARERAHILEGLVKALDNLDEVIALIRAAADPPTAKAGLMERFEFTDVQAQAILDMRLQRLTNLEREKIVTEYKELLDLIAHLERVLESEEMVLEIVLDELEQLRDGYASKRQTEIIPDAEDFSVEDLIAEEEMVVTVTRGGYIKRSALSSYRAQRRGGRGRRGMAPKAEDVVQHLFVGSTHATVLFFTTSGTVFARRVHELPDLGPSARGRALVNLLPLSGDEGVAALLAIRDFEAESDSYLVFTTRRGKVKRTRLEEYANIRANGLRAVNIDEGDELFAVHQTIGRSHVFLGTRHGQAIRFSETDARPMGRATAGVRGINLRDGDFVVEAATIDPDDPGDILVVTDLGFGKRTPADEFKVQHRGGYGVVAIKLTERNGLVAGIRHVHDDEILLVTEKGIMIRMDVAEIRRVGRSTQGVHLIRLDGDDRVVGVARLVETAANGDDIDDDETPEPGEPQ